MRCGVIASWSIYIDWILSDSCCIGYCSYRFCIRDNGSDQPGPLSIETLGVLGDESSLKDDLLGMTEVTWVGRGGDL